MGAQTILIFMGSYLFIYSTIASGQLLNGNNAQSAKSYSHRGPPTPTATTGGQSRQSYAQFRQYPEKKQDPVAPTWTDFVPQSPVPTFGNEDSFFQFRDVAAGADDLFNQIHLGPQTTHQLLGNTQQPSYSITPVSQQPGQSQSQPNSYNSASQPQNPSQITVERSKESEVISTVVQGGQQQQQQQQPQPHSVPQQQHHLQAPPPGHYIQAAFLNPTEPQPQTFLTQGSGPIITPAIQIMGPQQPIGVLSTGSVVPQPGPSDAEYAQFQKHLEAYQRYQDSIQGPQGGQSGTFSSDLSSSYPQKVLMSVPYKNPNGKPRGPKQLPFPYNMMASMVDSFRGKGTSKVNPFGTTKPNRPVTSSSQGSHPFATNPYEAAASVNSATQYPPTTSGFSFDSPQQQQTQSHGGNVFSPFSQTSTQSGSNSFPYSQAPAHTQQTPGGNSQFSSAHGPVQHHHSSPKQLSPEPSYPFLSAGPSTSYSQQPAQGSFPLNSQQSGPINNNYHQQTVNNNYPQQSQFPQQSSFPQQQSQFSQPQSSFPQHSYQQQNSAPPSFQPSSVYSQSSAPFTFNELSQSPSPSYSFNGSGPKFTSQYSGIPQPSSFTSTQTEIHNGKPVGLSNYPVFHSDVTGFRNGPSSKHSPSIISQWQQGVLSMAKDLLSPWMKPSTTAQNPQSLSHIRTKRNFGPNMPLIRISTPENAMDIVEDEVEESENTTNKE